MTFPRRPFILIVLVVLGLSLSACRSETQNRIRRNIQDFTGQTLHINLYALDGSIIYAGQVRGKVTRSSSTLSNNNEAAAGSYVFWYDERGVYHQTDLPYLLTSRPLSELDGVDQ